MPLHVEYRQEVYFHVLGMTSDVLDNDLGAEGPGKVLFFKIRIFFRPSLQSPDNVSRHFRRGRLGRVLEQRKAWSENISQVSWLLVDLWDVRIYPQRRLSSGEMWDGEKSRSRPICCNVQRSWLHFFRSFAGLKDFQIYLFISFYFLGSIKSVPWMDEQVSE